MQAWRRERIDLAVLQADTNYVLYNESENQYTLDETVALESLLPHTLTVIHIHYILYKYFSTADCFPPVFQQIHFSGLNCATHL